MQIVTDLTPYIETTEKGIRLTQAYFELALADKYQVFYLCQVDYPRKYRGDFLSSRLYDSLVKGILQHSSAELKYNYPIKGDRKQRPEAKKADELEVLAALAVFFDQMLKDLNANE